MQSGMSRRLRDDHTCGCDGIQLQTREAERGGDQHVQISKVQDILRQKILKRPDRQFLIEHHILKDTNVAPSLQVYEQSLKKARLADNLNDKLLKRPGPLELVEHNILETDPVLKEVIKDGLIPYEKTSCTYENVNLPPCPRGFDELGPLSERAVAPSDCHQKCSPAGSTLPLDGRQRACFYNTDSSGLQRDSAKQRIVAGPPVIATDPRRETTREPWTNIPETDSVRTNMKKRRNSLNNGGRPVSRLKSSLIFHEYRGPPEMSAPNSITKDCDDSHCNSSCKRSVMDTYRALLHQQQIFLELLHDLQLHESVPVSVVNGQQYSGAQAICQDSSANVFPTGYGFQQCSERSDLARSLDALSRLRVSDLRDKCRQRGLFVSGTKQDLIKRITRHDALQRKEPLINLKNEAERPADIDMSEPRAGRPVFQDACNKQSCRRPPARVMAEERSHIDEPGGAGAETSHCEATSGLYPGLEYLNKQVKTLQDLNFAQLFAAVDAAASAGCWSSGFEGLFSVPQQVNVEPAAGCYCEEHGL